MIAAHSVYYAASYSCCACPYSEARNSLRRRMRIRSTRPPPRTPKQLADLVKSNHKKNLEDLERMAKLVEEVQVDERKNAEYAVSLQNLKRLERIEKLSKAIRERMKLY